MRNKIYRALNKAYAVMMFASFFAGVLPLIPFIVALCIGGETGEAISNFIYKEYYPWVILLGSAAILIGLLAMYIGKVEGLSLKSMKSKKEDEENGDAK